MGTALLLFSWWIVVFIFTIPVNLLLAYFVFKNIFKLTWRKSLVADFSIHLFSGLLGIPLMAFLVNLSQILFYKLIPQLSKIISGEIWEELGKVAFIFSILVLPLLGKTFLETFLMIRMFNFNQTGYCFKKLIVANTLSLGITVMIIKVFFNDLL